MEMTFTGHGNDSMLQPFRAGLPAVAWRSIRMAVDGRRTN